jgi:hypothetical protein
VRALVATAGGVYDVDVETEEILGTSDAAPAREPFEATLPLVVAGDASGATRIAVVERRPPLMVSHDAGTTWREAGGGLPAGRDVAIHPDDPDLILYAARNRLFLSRDGGRFWRALAPELPEIERIAWSDMT